MKKRIYKYTFLVLLFFGVMGTTNLPRRTYNAILSSPLGVSIRVFLFHPPLKETVDTFEIVKQLKVIQAYDENGPISLRRIGSRFDGGYVVPELAIERASGVLGYGIGADISFEEETASVFGKPTWGYDGTCTPPQISSPVCYFVPECIVGRNSSLVEIEGNSTFDQQLNRLGLLDKKIFIKIDIEGNEYDVFPDILGHIQDITGLVLEIHFMEEAQIPKALNLLKNLNDHFHLVHVHGNNYCIDRFTTSNASGAIPRVLELSYVNKNLIQRHEISLNQSHPTKLDMPNWPGHSDSSFSVHLF